VATLQQTKQVDGCLLCGGKPDGNSKKNGPDWKTGSQSTVEPYDFTPLVCTPAVNGGLALWRHNKPINKKNKRKI